MNGGKKGFECKPAQVICLTREYNNNRKGPYTFQKVVAIGGDDTWYRVYNFKIKNPGRNKNNFGEKKETFWGMEETSGDIEYYEIAPQTRLEFNEAMRFKNLLSYLDSTNTQLPMDRRGCVDYIKVWGWDTTTNKEFITVLHVVQVWRIDENSNWSQCFLEDHYLGSIYEGVLDGKLETAPISEPEADLEEGKKCMMDAEYNENDAAALKIHEYFESMRLKGKMTENGIRIK